MKNLQIAKLLNCYIATFKKNNIAIQQYNNNKSRGGFTLIELLVVIGIIGALSAFLLANFVGIRQRARDGTRKFDLRQIQAALESYRADSSSGAYPASPLPACGSSLTSAAGTSYMKKIPCDPLNTGQYVYTYFLSGNAYYLYSCLENINDSQKDTSNNLTYCSGGSINWSYTLQNP